jgi:hypothetical protein
MDTVSPEESAVYLPGFTYSTGVIVKTDVLFNEYAKVLRISSNKGALTTSFLR